MGGWGTKHTTLLVAAVALLSATTGLIANLGGARDTICSLPAAKKTCLESGLITQASPEPATSVSLPSDQNPAPTTTPAAMPAPVVPDRPEPPANRNDLSGSWTGYYSGGGNPRTKFDLDISWRAPGTFRGVILEDDTVGRMRGVESGGVERGSQVAGANSEDGSVRFIKQYDCTDDVCHEVVYEGVLDEAGRTITGTWSIGPTYGQFKISRP